MDIRKDVCDDRQVPRPATGQTPVRNIRVPLHLWRDYKAACAEQGTTPSDDLRAYITRKVRAWKRRTLRD